jgi:hypothetical protein
MMMPFLYTGLALLLSLGACLMVPGVALADGLVQLRPLGSGNATSVNTGTTTGYSVPSSTAAGTTSGNTSTAWQPVTSNGRIDLSTGNTVTTGYTTTQPITTTGSMPALTTTGNLYQTGLNAILPNQKLTVRLNERISSQDSKPGDTVSATLESPISSGLETIAPAGSEVLGSIIESSEAKRAGIHGEVDLHFYTVVKPNGERVALDAIVVTKHGGSTVRPNNYAVDAARGVGIAAAGTGVGALTGLALGGVFSAAGSGAALGTAVGGAAGIGYALWRKGEAVELPKGSLLQLKTVDSSKANLEKVSKY